MTAACFTLLLKPQYLVESDGCPDDNRQIISFSQTGNKQGKQAAESKVLEFTADRPDYNRAVKVVQTAAQRAQEGG